MTLGVGVHATTVPVRRPGWRLCEPAVLFVGVEERRRVFKMMPGGGGL